jgi:hypothetical protein
VVAIQMTDDGPEVDPLGEVKVHPAAELFPLMQGQAFDDLVADIREHGLRELVVMTPDGHLLDGRNRWRACAKAGVEPKTRVEHGEPWAYVISTNVHRRHLTESQRAMIAARIATRAPGQRAQPSSGRSVDLPDHEALPPSIDRAAELFNISASSIKRARDVRSAAPVLQEVVESGVVPVFTAARVAHDLSCEQQEEFARHVQEGAEPKRLARQMGVGGAAGTRPVTEARTDNRSPGRHRYLTTAALRSLGDSLSALDMILRSTEGLDPAITREEAARWVDGLSKGRRSLYGVVKLLTERKESSS